MPAATRCAPHRSVWLLALALALPAAAAGPEAPASAPASKSAAHAVKAATPRQQLKSEAAGLALATTTVEAISEAQMEMAGRVLTGLADCEFKQRINVTPIAGQPGHFKVDHKGKQYRMVPQETGTGAVRLEDRVAGVMWLQIPVKSMLMNVKIGQRMVDGCQHAAQREASTAVAAAGSGLGIVATGAARSASATQ